MSFPRYPKYKPSGVEWLGDVPEHWAPRRLKHIFRERDQRSVNGTETLLSVSAYTGVSPRADLIEEGDHITRAESLEGYKRCYANDLVVNIMLAWNRGLGVTEYDGIVSPSYCVYGIIDDSDPRYINYLMRSDEYTGYFKAFSTGVIDSRLRIYPDTFLQLHCCVPNLMEQRAIAAFLDRETAKIDALVAEQERLIELLKEKRQAVISHAVTKGLDPKAKLKPSGVEWLGDVPGHWGVQPIRSVARLESGHTPSRNHPEYWESCTVPWFTLADIWQVREAGRSVISETKEMISELGIANSAARKLPAGTVMLSRTASVGFAAIMGVEMATTQDFANWVCGPRLVPEFLLQVFRSMKSEFDRRMMGSTHNTIYMPDIQAMRCAVPPVAEQRAIAAFLDRETAKIDVLVADAEAATRLLRERRAALISAAVTGQIDVRNAAPSSAAVS